MLLLVGLADLLVDMFAPRPLPWAILIPALTPLLTVIFVIVPMLNAEKPYTGTRQGHDLLALPNAIGQASGHRSRVGQSSKLLPL